MEYSAVAPGLQPRIAAAARRPRALLPRAGRGTMRSMEPAAPLGRLGGVECWIFDLDNTLYPIESNLFGQIDVRMRDYIADALGLAPAAARAMQKDYFRTYGTTMRGLSLRHGIDPASFLDYVHDIDHSVLEPAPALAAALEALPGRKMVFTNGSASHAARVLDRLGIAGRFDSVFDIAAAGFVPKPFDQPYDRLIDRHGIDAARAAFFEDSLANLAPAAARGMVTVWMRNGRDAPAAGADHTVERLDGWLAGVAARLARETPNHGGQA